MRDIWYGDHRDLVKWSALYRLAEQTDSPLILQLAYYRRLPSNYPTITIDQQEVSIPSEVRKHFRNLQNVHRISSKIQVKVFDRLFDDRDAYLKDALRFISSFQSTKCVVFLDPDTGLEPTKGPGYEHVLESEARAIFSAMKPRDVFVLYQHQTNRNGQEWIGPKKQQLARSIGVPDREIKVANGATIARDVVLYFALKA